MRFCDRIKERRAAPIGDRGKRLCADHGAKAPVPSGFRLADARTGIICDAILQFHSSALERMRLRDYNGAFGNAVRHRGIVDIHRVGCIADKSVTPLDAVWTISGRQLLRGSHKDKQIGFDGTIPLEAKFRQFKLRRWRFEKTMVAWKLLGRSRGRPDNDTASD